MNERFSRAAHEGKINACPECEESRKRLSGSPDLAALEAQFREKAVAQARRIGPSPDSCYTAACGCAQCEARGILALHAEIEKLKGRT